MTNLIRLASAALVVATLGAASLAQANEAENKEIVGLVGDSVFNKHDFSLLEQYMTEGYIQHNPLVPQGREGFRQFFEAPFSAEVFAFRRGFFPTGLSTPFYAVATGHRSKPKRQTTLLASINRLDRQPAIVSLAGFFFTRKLLSKP